MTIQYHTFDTLQQYRDQRYLALLWLEETGVVHTYLYRDAKGYATTGVGFKVDSNWRNILMAFGFDYDNPSTAEQGYIEQIKKLFYKDGNPNNAAEANVKTFTASGIATLQTQLNTIMQNRAKDAAIPGDDKRPTFTFNDTDEIKATFQIIADARETILNNWLSGISVPYSNERITLLSLVYNNVIGPGKSPSLHNALFYGNRAEAWYEIRYNSNKKGSGFEVGIAKRRYYESDYFGLYNDGIENKSVEEKNLEYKTIMRMYTLHKDEIDAYEILYGAQVAQANNDYQVTWVQTLANNLNDAKSFIITNFANGQPIDNVFVGKGLSSYEYKDNGNYKDTNLIGTDHNDLIFGEKGDDLLYGFGGNDVMYGGEGDDMLIGGIGDDILMGGENDDWYIINAGDGVDRIEDKQGTNNKIFLCGKEIEFFYYAGDGIYKSPDGSLTGEMGTTGFAVTDDVSNTVVTLLRRAA